MNYGDLLYRAHENKCSASHKEVRCYKTTFAPPKKITKSKVSSDNIKKFLARKEDEEKKKLLEEQKKKNELLALRNQDKKAKKRVQVMLKRTKSANKSVMEDAIDNINTADTIDGPNQCDDDDYGYVSQEASAFYNKLMNKYENMPPEPSVFSKMKREVKDLVAAKDRVKQALQKEAEEAELPHKRKRKHKEANDDSLVDTDSSDEMTEDQREEPNLILKETANKNNKQDNQKAIIVEVKHRRKNVSTGPPPLDFNELLKIAKEKQYQPVVIENSKPKVPTRLMTSKEKAEFLQEEERKRNRQKKDRNNVSSISESISDKVKRKEVQANTQSNLQVEKNKTKEPYKGKEKVIEIVQEQPSTKVSSNLKAYSPKSSAATKKEFKKFSQSTFRKYFKESIRYDPIDTNTRENVTTTQKRKIVDEQPYDPSDTNTRENVATMHKRKIVDEQAIPKYIPKPKVSIANVDKELSDIDREIELLRKRKTLLALKAKEEKSPIPKYVPTAIKPQAKINKDVSNKEKEYHSVKKKPILKKRVIASDSEYDSELDDFIDDGPEESHDYSKVISEIFGYDKSRYREVDDDGECMESNFAQQMREEYVSTKIGIMEDLEDIRKEQEEKRRLKERKKIKGSHY